MQWLITMTIAGVLAGMAFPDLARCEDLSTKVLTYLEGSWEGTIASEGDVSSRLGNIGKSVYSGTAKMTADKASLLQIGGWSKIGVSGGVGWARYFKLGSKPNTLVIYVYSTHADHAIVQATVKPQGAFFEIVGEKTGVTTDRKLTASAFSLVVNDEDSFTIRNTARKEDGADKPDEVLQYVRKKN